MNISLFRLDLGGCDLCVQSVEPDAPRSGLCDLMWVLLAPGGCGLQKLDLGHNSLGRASREAETEDLLLPSAEELETLQPPVVLRRKRPRSQPSASSASHASPRIRTRPYFWLMHALRSNTTLTCLELKANALCK
jgi:hypothetical protein